MRRGGPLTRVLTVIGCWPSGSSSSSRSTSWSRRRSSPRPNCSSPEPTLVPQSPTLASYEDVLFGRNMITLLGNSVIVGLVSTILALIIAMAMRYPIARLPTTWDGRAS